MGSHRRGARIFCFDLRQGVPARLANVRLCVPGLIKGPVKPLNGPRVGRHVPPSTVRLSKIRHPSGPGARGLIRQNKNAAALSTAC